MFLYVQETHSEAMIVLLPNQGRHYAVMVGIMYFLGAGVSWGYVNHFGKILDLFPGGKFLFLPTVEHC